MKILLAFGPMILMFGLVLLVVLKMVRPNTEDMLALEAAKAGCTVTPVSMNGVTKNKVECPCGGPARE